MPVAEPFRLALAQYPIGRPADFEHYAANLEQWFERGARDGARLLVFPEYGGMELASIFGAAVEGDVQRQIEMIGGVIGAVDDLHERLARQFGVYALAASLPLIDPDNPEAGPVNRARFFGPGGGRGHQDKRVMTRFEREEWGIGGGDALFLFETAIGRIGVVLCYDIEFPLVARALVAAGAELILVPSCTDTVAGYNRVRIGARARALESQCPVAISPTVGVAPWSPAVDVNVGAAGLYGPPDSGFPETGILVEGTLDKPGWVFADFDPVWVAEARERGQVLNYHDWGYQPGYDESALVAVRQVAVG